MEDDWTRLVGRGCGQGRNGHFPTGLSEPPAVGETLHSNPRTGFRRGLGTTDRRLLLLRTNTQAASCKHCTRYPGDGLRGRSPSAGLGGRRVALATPTRHYVSRPRTSLQVFVCMHANRRRGPVAVPPRVGLHPADVSRRVGRPGERAFGCGRFFGVLSSTQKPTRE